MATYILSLVDLDRGHPFSIASVHTQNYKLRDCETTPTAVFLTSVFIIKVPVYIVCKEGSHGQPILTLLDKLFMIFKVKSSVGNYALTCRPRWSRGNVLASRSKVHGFKPS